MCLANGQNSPKTNDPGGVFYGWYIVAAMFFTSLIGVGSRQGFGVFVKVWEEDFGTSVGMISVAAGIGWTVNGLVQPIAGSLTDRFGGRRVMIVGSIGMALATIGVGFMPNVYGLIVMYGFVLSALAGGAFGTPTTSDISRWFQRNRGRAISFVMAGGSAGGLIMVPFAAYLLVISDWRTAWFVLGGMIFLFGVPLIVGIVRDDPADMGLEPDGGSDGNPDQPNLMPHQIRVAPLETTHWRDSIHSAPLWQLSVAFWVCGITTGMIAVHFVRWAESEDISAGTAALAFGVLSVINGAGLIFVGWISDYMPRKNLLGIVYLVRAGAFLALIFLPGQAALWSFAVLGGMSWLATVPMTNGLTADIYGLRNIGMINGLIMMSHQLGGGAAVIAAGVVFDVWGTYDAAFVAGFATLVLAGVVSFSINESKYSIRYQKPVPITPNVATAASDGD